MPLMRTLVEIAARVRAALRRGRLEDDLREEIRDHLERRTARLVAGGMDPREAAAAARRMFGNVTAIREETREMWGFRWLDSMAQDLRFGVRMLRRSPVFTMIAVASLAIGIGATTAVFGLADAMLLQTLPVRDPGSLVVLRWTAGQTYVFESLNGYSFQDEHTTASTSFSRAAYEAVRARAGGSIDVFGFADLYGVNLSIDGVPETGRGQAVTGNYLAVLGVAPAAGRAIVESDDTPGAPAVAMLGHAYAERRFGGPEAAVGRSLVLNGVPCTIVGVLPRGFRGTLQVGQQYDVAVPTSLYAAVTRAEDPGDPNHWWLLMMGRLAPGVTAGDVQPVLDLAVKQTVAAAKPELAAKDLPRVVLEPGAQGQLEDRDAMREPLRMMAAVVAIVLLVACANVANLLLARGRARTREVAVRVAIGAPRRRVVRQFLTESLLLALLGGAFGVAVAYWLTAALLPALAASEPLSVAVTLHWRGLLFVVGLATVASVLVGLVPALRATDVRLAPGLQESGRGAGAGGREPLSRALVVLQVALSTVLLTAAGLLVYSVRALESVEPGFNPHGVLIFSMNPQLNGYDEQRARDFYSSALERLSGLPGVRSASLSSHTLIANSSAIGVARAVGTPAPPAGSPEAQEFMRRNQAWRLTVDGRFFETMGLRFVQGRTFTTGDSMDAQPVAIVNESLARQLFGTRDAIGRRLVLGLREGAPQLEIVGIVADARYTSVRRPPPPTAYLHYRQQPLGRATFAVRTAGDPPAIAGAAREALRRLDPTVPVTAMRTQDDQIRASLERERLFAQLSSLLGAAALLLSAIGLYGLLAYAVSRRTAEIGVRMALGAERTAVGWMIMRQALVLVGAGLVLGAAGARAGTRVIESLLFGLAPTHPAAIGAAVPARRAARIDPLVALRTE